MRRKSATVRHSKNCAEISNCKTAIRRFATRPKICLTKICSRFRLNHSKKGFVSEIDTFAVGESLVKIGGGRTKVDDKIDYAVGYRCEKKIGDQVGVGETLGILFCRNENQFQKVGERLQNAFSVEIEQPVRLKLIKEVVS